MEILHLGSEKEVDKLVRSQYDNNKTTYFRLSDYPHEIDLDIEFGKECEIFDRDSNITIMTSNTYFKKCI